MSYRSASSGEHLTSRGYLEFIDQRLGLSKGTIYDLCQVSMKSKTESKSGVKVTFRGETEGSVQPRKAIFLIEFKMVKGGEELDRVVQVHLQM